MKPSVVHFEIPADDLDRAKAFYSGLFGWEITDPHNMEYFFVKTKGENEPGIDGGIMKRQMPEQTTVVYTQVDSIDQYLTKTEELGGKVIVPKTPIPGMGWFAVILDTENNSFGFFQDDKEAK